MAGANSIAAVRAYENGVGASIRRAPETGKLHLLEEKTCFCEVTDAAERVDEGVVSVNIGFAVKLSHPVEG